MNKWIDDSDLPKLHSIQLGNTALRGDSSANQATINKRPYYFKNTLTMRSEIE